MGLLKKLIKIKGENNQIISKKCKTNKLYKRSPIDITGDNNIVKIHEKNDIYKLRLSILGSNNEIIIEEDCKGILQIVVSGSNIKVHIGKNCQFRGCEMAIFENGSVLEFGNGSGAARDSRLYASDFHTIYDMDTKKPLNQGTHLRVGSHVWIGEGVMILKNNTIASNTMIAAHSIVTKDLTESHAIYAGNPATLKKQNINWDWRTYDEYLDDFNNGRL